MNENCFARAFGGPVVRVNAGGDAPRTPPLLVTSDQGHFLCFLQEQIFGDERKNIFGGLTVKIELQETLPNKWRA